MDNNTQPTQEQVQNINTVDVLMSNNNYLPNDNTLTQEEKVRNTEYTTLIQNYQTYLKKTLNFKLHTRWIAFVIFVGCFVIITVISCMILCHISHAKVSNLKDLVSLLTASISLVSTVIVLPTKIIDFIYNKDEDSYIVDIIKSTQEYDKAKRSNIQ